eukprot:763994-Hanusia_phi.AAC.1
MLQSSHIVRHVVIILQLMMMTSADWKSGNCGVARSLPWSPHGDFMTPHGIGGLTMRLRGGKDTDPFGDVLSAMNDNVQRWQQDSKKLAEQLGLPRMSRHAHQVLSDASHACGEALDALPGAKTAKNFFLVPWLNFRQNDPILSERVACSIAAVASYVCVLQFGQGIGLAARVSHYTSKGLPASIIGFNSVAVAGLVAGEVADKVYKALRANAPR